MSPVLQVKFHDVNWNDVFPVWTFRPSQGLYHQFCMCTIISRTSLEWHGETYLLRSGLELGDLIVWAVAGRDLKGVSVKYWLNGSLSTVTVTVWRCWYIRVTPLTGLGLRSVCTPVHPSWFVERLHIQFRCNCRLGFISVARAILVLLPAEVKPGWTRWSLSCDGTEAY